MIHSLLQAFWFLLPAGIANMAPVVSAKLPILNQYSAAVDGGRKFRGQPIFGDHKTWRGLISGMLVATLALGLQQIATKHFGWAQSLSVGIDYAALPTLILGPLFGFGALGADAIESFFKRQYKFKSGDSWLPFDQIDYILGAILVSLPFVRLPIAEYLMMVVVYFGLHLAVSFVGWLVGLKQKPI